MRRIQPLMKAAPTTTEIILPEPKFPPRDPVLEARCQKLRAQQQAMEYRRMTSNVDGTIQGLHKESDTDSFSKQSKKKEKKCYFRKICRHILNLF